MLNVTTGHKKRNQSPKTNQSSEPVVHWRCFQVVVPKFRTRTFGEHLNGLPGELGAAESVDTKAYNLHLHAGFLLFSVYILLAVICFISCVTSLL